MWVETAIHGAKASCDKEGVFECGEDGKTLQFYQDKY